jgi:hypothetical protein
MDVATAIAPSGRTEGGADDQPEAADAVRAGSGGVFTINAKNHPGARVWVGGGTVMIGQSRLPYVRNARFEASRAARLLSSAVGQQVPVMGIVALLCDDLTIKTPPIDVLVITRRQLRKWLTRLRSPPSTIMPAGPPPGSRKQPRGR